VTAYLLAALSSALYVLGYAGFDVWPLSLVALVPVLHAVERHVVRDAQAIAVGACFGALTQAAGYSWLLATLQDFSGLPLLACVLVFALLCLYQGGQLALFVWLLFRVRRAGRDALAFAPLCYGAVELAYPMLFPSPFAGSLHAVPLLLQLAELGGPTLVSMLLVAVNAAVYAGVSGQLGLRARPAHLLGATLTAAALACGYGALRMAQVDAQVTAAPKLKVGLVQANMGSWQKREDRAEGRRRHLEQSMQLEHTARPALLVWPETALHYPIPANARSLSPWLRPLTTPVLLGALAHRAPNGRAELYNSAFLTDVDAGVLGRTDKVRLIPFAEHIPFGDRWPWLYDLSRGSGQLSAGGAPSALSLGSHRLAVLICYEDVLPGFVRDVVARTDPHLLVNISNDAWFGRSREPFIHLALAKLRAIEQRRYLVRAGNSGVSAVIDSAGRVVAQAAPFTRANLAAQVALLGGTTPFARAGDWPGWLALLITVYAVVQSRRAPA
jgi:apolipoprotein N-acyltransferase